MMRPITKRKLRAREALARLFSGELRAVSFERMQDIATLISHVKLSVILEARGSSLTAFPRNDGNFSRV
jgi:hypothetical protein